MPRSDPHPFINITALEKPDRASRRNARSYVMRGKNTGKRRKHLANQTCLGSWIDEQSTAGSCQNPELLPQELVCTNQVPRQIGSEWTVFQFAEEIGPHTRQRIYKCRFPLIFTQDKSKVLTISSLSYPRTSFLSQSDTRGPCF
jgi:hypothetical protein